MSDDNHDGDGDDDLRGSESQLDGAIQTPAPTENTPKRQASDQLVSKTDPGAMTRNETVAKGQSNLAARRTSASWFAIPAPLKRLFDRFPLVTYAENGLPTRASRKRAENILYIFTNEEGAVDGRPSFNPSCLKWQTYLHAARIQFRTASSNNHASPSGSLPFLLVGNQSKNSNTEPSASLAFQDVVPGNRIRKWVKDQKTRGSMIQRHDFGLEVYASLLDNRIRKAWLYQLYLHPANADLLKRLYVEPCSSNPLVQMTIASQLRSAAELEIIKASTTSGSKYEIRGVHLMQDADEAFAALSSLLGNASWFSQSQRTEKSSGNASYDPGPFDASVFAYTHLILSSLEDGINGVLEWKHNQLGSVLRKYRNLVEHRERILQMYY